MIKLTSYQKLKAKIAELEKEKRTLVLRPESIDAEKIRYVVETKHEQAEVIMFGSREGNGHGVSDSIKRLVGAPVLIVPHNGGRSFFVSIGDVEVHDKDIKALVKTFSDPDVRDTLTKIVEDTLKDKNND